MQFDLTSFEKFVFFLQKYFLYGCPIKRNKG